MTLEFFLRQMEAAPGKPNSPRLRVSAGFLTDEMERDVNSGDYVGLPYCYVLNVGDAEVERYDSGGARYVAPIDVVFEARAETSKPYLTMLCNAVRNGIYQVDEVAPGVPLAPGVSFRVVGGYRPESRRKSFFEAMLRLETLWE